MKPKILKEYEKYLKTVKCFSDNTIKSYSNDLMLFFNYILEYWEIGINAKDINLFILINVKEADIISFLVYLNYFRDNSSSTRERRLNAILRFYKFLINKYHNYDIKMPINSFWIERTIHLPKYLTLNEAKQIQGIFNISNSRYPKRDNLVIDMLLNTGIRIRELSNIDIKDINLDKKCIKIIAKGGIEREVMINEYIKDKLIDYVDDFNINRPLFINQKKQRLGTDGIEDICKKAFKLIGKKDFTAHALRHTAATLMYQYVKPDILLLKEFLGHKSVISTEIYSHISDERVKNAVERNPLNKIYIGG